MNSKKNSINLNNQSGFMMAEFLFSLTLVAGCGIIIFGLTFSLATIEISQYIVWSTARNYSAANTTEPYARIQATTKFNNLADQFPKLTGRGAGANSPWFNLTDVSIGDLATSNGGDADLIAKLSSDKDNKDQGGYGERRQPWIGAKASLELKLFASLNVPFLGPIATDKTKFTFPIRAFILRHPSQKECYDFYSASQRYSLGIQKLEPQMASLPDGSSSYVPMEDNGC